MKRFLRIFCLSCLVSVLVSPSVMRAQQSGSAADSGASQSDAQASDSAAGNSPVASQRATEQQDDTAAYRHSASVRAIGRLLHLDPDAAARVFEYLNFAILALAVLYIVAKVLPKAIKARGEAIQKQLADAREATEQANQRLRAVEEKFARLDEEIAAIRTQSEREGAADETRMKDLLESERQRIVAAAEQEIVAAASSARRELKRFAGDLAIDRARQRLLVDEERDRSLVRQFTRELSSPDLNSELGSLDLGKGGRN